MRRRSAALLAGWLVAAHAFAAGDELPPPLAPFEAEYRVSNGTVPVGTASFRLERNAGGWRYQSVLQVRGLFALFVDGPLRETTWLEADGDSLRPLAYRHQRGEDEVRVIFNWSRHEARVSGNGDSHSVDIEPTTRDQSSAILAVIGALAAGERSVTLPGIDDDGESQELHFEVTGEEQVQVPLGRYQAMRVERTHDDGRKTITWLSPELAWLPVRVEQREDGELVARLDLTALTDGGGS